MDKKEVTCCGLQSYYIQIRPKEDNPLPLENVSEFFNAMSLKNFCMADFPCEPNRPDAICVMVVGLDLSEMIDDIESGIKDTGYVYSVMIGPEVVVYDYLRK